MKRKFLKAVITMPLAFLLFFVLTFQLHGDSILNPDNKISIDLKGMDIIEVLKMLASKGNMNLVIGNDVRGRVTMFLKDVDIENAFEIILIANGLARDKRGDIIYVMTQKDYESFYGEQYSDKRELKVFKLKYARVSEAANILNQIKTSIGNVISDESSGTVILVDNPKALLQAESLIKEIDGPVKTMIFELGYAKAEDLKDTIEKMLTKEIGALQIDERTNKIAVTDSEDNLQKIERIITTFDDRGQQVLIESKIIEITLRDEYKLGVDWKSVFHALDEKVTVKSGFKLGSSGTITPGGELVVGTFGTDDYSLLIQALKTIGNTNVLSSPRIMALNNEEAKILVGSSEPYATNTVTQGTSTTTTATSLTFLEVGVKLYVTPTINRNGFVTIKIKPEVSSKAGNYTYGNPATTVPIISTTQAETSIMVRDGVTIVIAGLIKDERSGAKSKVPILGDIPIMGGFFRKTDNAIMKKELVIFLTPHILSGKEDHSEPVLFTMPEEPTFEKRELYNVSPDDFKDGKAVIERGPEENTNITGYGFEDYFSAIKNRVVQNLFISKEERQSLKQGDTVKISFSLYADGKLSSEPEIVKASNDFFGGIAIRAVKNSSLFPPFPDFIKETERNFTMDIVYDGKK